MPTLLNTATHLDTATPTDTATRLDDATRSPTGRDADRAASAVVSFPASAVPVPLRGHPGRPGSDEGPRGGRDPFIDLLRIFGMALVVLQHWTMPVLAFSGDRIGTGNAFSSPGTFVITWIGQVMPIVFFAGGAANAIAWRRGAADGGPAWLAARLRRLAWPLLPLAAVWLPLPHILLAAGLPEQPVTTAARLAGQLLWFLAVYLVAVTLTPLMFEADRRHGARVIVALVAGAIVTDVVRFSSGVEALGYANIVFVWLAVHQLGLRYAEGRLRRTGHRPWAMALSGFGTAALLVAFGPYPASMVGMPGAAISNMAPPTLALLAVAFGQIGLALALRPFIVRQAATPRVAALAAWAAPRMMTIYLWHMTALAVVTGVVVIGFGIATPTPWSGWWFAGLPLWLTALGLILWPLLRWFTRFERPLALPYGKPGLPAVAAATLLIGAGILTLTVVGFSPGFAPFLGTLAVLAGLTLTFPRST
ncbi:Uncharacterized membrane protein YeiB [Sinosporangium album]|uniref:Uncharacterized membrane protein YeiB n=1 Tax=Sinosporangium album TaxID=504805 RepID=A0A1G8H238_9ACTN|nr:acyltransferase [Sinosporangium album]SDI00697.1 Uncharacterized membrane protein YeiB [Sinosporangium album]